MFNVNAWIGQNTPVGANTNVALLTPQQMHTAYNTSFVPAGNPVTVEAYPQGYNIGGT